MYFCHDLRKSSSSFSLNVIPETNDSHNQTNLTEYVICQPKGSTLFAEIKKRNETIYLLKLFCQKKKINKRLHENKEALIKDLITDFKDPIKHNDLLIYKKIRKFPYFKILKFMNHNRLSKKNFCDLSDLELRYDINSSKFYEDNNDIQHHIKNEILKLMNDDIKKKIPFFVLNIQKMNQNGKICLLKHKIPSPKISFDLPETFPRKNLTISLEDRSFLLKTLKIKFQGNSYEFAYNNASSRQINLTHKLVITENQANFLRIDFTFNKFFMDHRILELKYEDIQQSPQLIKKTSGQKRVLQNNPYIFMISPVDSNHSTDPDCSILVIFFSFLLFHIYFDSEFRIFFE